MTLATLTTLGLCITRVYASKHRRKASVPSVVTFNHDLASARVLKVCQVQHTERTDSKRIIMDKQYILDGVRLRIDDEISPTF